MRWDEVDPAELAELAVRVAPTAGLGDNVRRSEPRRNIDSNNSYTAGQEQPMKIVAYIRVSTDRQAEQGFGLQVQERAVRQWAKEQGHRIVAVHRDEGVSGSNGLDTRKGLPDALAAIADGQAAGLLVPALDRLARDLVIQEQIIAEVRRAGGAVYSVSATENDSLRDDTNDPARKLIRQMLGAVAEYERSMIVMRLRNGRRRKAEAGGYAYGAPPLGSQAVNGELVPVPGEAETVERIRELNAEGLSLRKIAEVLTAEGRKTKRGTTWHPPTVARALQRTEGVAK